MKKTLLAVSLSLALVGCATDPKTIVAPDLPDAFSAVVAENAKEVVNLQWWKDFNDPELDRLVDLAFKNATDLKVAMLNVEKADAVLTQSGAKLLPSIGVDGSAEREGKDFHKHDTSSFKVGASAAWELDFWGKNYASRVASLESRESAKYAAQSVRLSLAAGVCKTYFDWLATNASIKSTALSVENREKALKIVENKFNVGVATPVDVENAKSALATIQADLASLKLAREKLITAMQTLVGDLTVTMKEGDLMAVPSAVKPGIPSEVLLMRPDVRQAEAELRAKGALIHVARAAFFPSISLTADTITTGGALNQLFHASTWSAGLMIDLPIFSAGARIAKYNEAKIDQQVALQKYRQAAFDAYKDVQDALNEVHYNKDIAEARRIAKDSADKAERRAMARYEAGVAGFMELLDAQRSANTANVAYYNAHEGELNAIVNLMMALGAVEEYKAD
ncbi:MAG: efflux transporter outer membrane subunit [Burkholderiaceae bacterium]|nr:efflux transporter outer membrane subunit [Burkholderiaceae bacterium]